MPTIKNFFATRWGIISVGAFIGIFAPFLQKWGNPPNMGICVACMERDIAGAGFSHNFGLASTPDGIGPYGIHAVIIGLLTCLFIGLTMRKEVP